MEQVLISLRTQYTGCGQLIWVTYHIHQSIITLPTDPTQWRALRAELDHHHEVQRMQHRFRKSPERYLAAFEEKLIKERLPA